MEFTPTESAGKSRLLPRWVSWSHALILLITATFWCSFLSKQSLADYVYKRDFLCLYIGARAVLQGEASAELYNFPQQWRLTAQAIAPHERATLLPYVYPAYVAVVLAPLGKLSLDRAFLVWTAVNLLATAWLIKRLMALKSVFPGQHAAILLALFAWVPLQLTLSHGQMGMLCTLAVLESMAALDARKPLRAGCWLALGLVKPQLMALPLLALLLWRCWLALVSFSAILLALAGASFARLGFWIPDYVRFLAEFNRGGRIVSMYPMAMHNWRGLISVLLGNSSSRAATSGWGALTIASVFTVVLLCLGGAQPFASSQPAPSRWKERYAIVIVLGILTSPHLYFHDWVMAFPALVILYVSASLWPRLNPRRDRLVTILLWIIAMAPLVCFAVQFNVWPSGSHLQLVPWYMGMVSGIAVVCSRQVEKVEAQHKAL
jgi:Glycosyltransferase family 87